MAASPDRDQVAQSTEVIKELTIRAELPGEAHTPIVALTAGVMSEDRTACLDAGMNAYLSKPIRMRDLVEVLGQVLPGGSPQRARATGTSPSTASSADSSADSA